MPRKTYSNKQKREIISKVNLRLAEGESLKAICRDLVLFPQQVRKWKEQEQKLIGMNQKALSICPGKPSQLHAIEEDLLKWMFHLREQGMPVSIRIVCMRAAELDPSFRRKTPAAKYQAVRLFTIAHRFAIRIGTHTSQKRPEETQEEARVYVRSMVPYLQTLHRDQRYIINMDQTPVWFSMDPKTTLEQIGSPTINIRTSTNSTVRCTVAVTLTASGLMLPPMMVKD